MFIGHFAVGFALKRVAPRASLGPLIAAAQFLDLLWPWFLLLGWEHVRLDPGNTAFTPLAFDSYPISHSLVMAIVWGVAFSGLYLLRTHNRIAAIWIAAAVVSHWALDWITHRPDLPIMPGDSTKVGLGLWNSVPATLIVESAMFAAGVWVYARATRARYDWPRQLLDLRRRAVAHLRREPARPAAARRALARDRGVRRVVVPAMGGVVRSPPHAYFPPPGLTSAVGAAGAGSTVYVIPENCISSHV